MCKTSGVGHGNRDWAFPVPRAAKAREAAVLSEQSRTAAQVESAAGSGRMGCLPPTDRFRPKTDYRDSGKQTLNVEITGLRGLPRGSG